MTDRTWIDCAVATTQHLRESHYPADADAAPQAGSGMPDLTAAVAVLEARLRVIDEELRESLRPFGAPDEPAADAAGTAPSPDRSAAPSTPPAAEEPPPAAAAEPVRPPAPTVEQLAAVLAGVRGEVRAAREALERAEDLLGAVDAVPGTAAAAPAPQPSPAAASAPSAPRPAAPAAARSATVPSAAATPPAADPAQRRERPAAAAAPRDAAAVQATLAGDQAVRESAQAATDAAFTGELDVYAGPFADAATLNAFEEALRRVPRVGRVDVRGFEDAEVHIAVSLDGETKLVSELERLAPTRFTVQQWQDRELRLGIEAEAA